MDEAQPLDQENSLNEVNNNSNRFCILPKFTIEKIIRLTLVTIGTVIMIINFYYGIAISHYNPYCLDDMSHNATAGINEYFYNHTTFNYILKAIFSFLIDIGIIYTLIVWSLFSNNLRLITSGVSYTAFNILVRFIHKTAQPANAAFTENHFFSIFVNYQITTYSFFSLVMGLVVICAFEWKRNFNEIYFWYFIILFFVESIIMIVLQGHFFHEIFTAWVIGHYLFIMNEKLLCWIFGKEYLNLNNAVKEDDHLEKKIDEVKSNNSNKDKLQTKAEEAKQELLQNN